MLASGGSPVTPWQLIAEDSWPPPGRGKGLVLTASLFVLHTYLSSSVCISASGAPGRRSPMGWRPALGRGVQGETELLFLKGKTQHVGLRNVLGNVSNLFLLHRDI